MTLTSKTALTWQAKTAYVCAALFALTSISTNAVYGWSKGDTLPSSLIWAVLAIATGATLLLSTAALFKALAARSWGQAAFIALGLSLCATYSIVAAVGSATGQRMTAALTEDNVTKRRADLQTIIDEAVSRLEEAQRAEALAASREASSPGWRPSSEIEAEIQGLLLDPLLESCREINGKHTREKCPHVADLRKELASALSNEQERASAQIAFDAAKADRAKWQSALDKARAAIANLPPPKVVNSDAEAVVNFLNALGYEPAVPQVNTALALLSVLLIEMGGSVSLAVGMAFSLSEPTPEVPFEKPVQSALVKDEEEALSPSPSPSRQKPSNDGQLKSLQQVQQQAPSQPFTSVRDRLLSDVNGNKGGLRSTYGALGTHYGVSATRIGQVVRDLKKEGLVRVRSSRSGTTIVPMLGLAAS